MENESRNESKGTDIDVVVVGGGPAGLAVAACLQRAGVSYELLEREQTVAPAWKRHYDRLHLHTSRSFSSLPHSSMPRDYPRYPSRDQVVAYLDRYARDQGVTPRFSVEVTGVRVQGQGWQVESSAGTYQCLAVVIATGVNGVPNLAEWPGLAEFPGAILHSSRYQTGQSLAGKDVLVVGLGNSGGEIALDLAECGARPVVSVRGPLNIVPRDVFGVPVLAITIPLSLLPPRLSDALVWPILKLYYPSYRRLGLSKAAVGPFRQIAEDERIPLLDIGTIRAIRRGLIEIEGDVVSLEKDVVRFAGENTRRFDAIVLATGYKPSVPLGLDLPEGRGVEGAGDGIYFCGFYVSPTGMLREVGREAQSIVARILDKRARDGSS